jgi:hypothetical protein
MPSIRFLANVINEFLLSITLQLPQILFFLFHHPTRIPFFVENLGGCGLLTVPECEVSG